MRDAAAFRWLTFLGLAAFAVFAGWAVFVASKIDGGWASLAPVWPYVLGGLVLVGGLTGVLMWLAFYSASRGYDDRADPRESLTPPRRKP